MHFTVIEILRITTVVLYVVQFIIYIIVHLYLFRDFDVTGWFFRFLPGFRGVLPGFFSHSGTLYVCLKYTNVKREEEDPKD
jgi:hypothetical protein